MPEVVAFLPCRAGSQRVLSKNTRPFAGEADGLLGIKLRQLGASRLIDRIVLSTNDPLVVEIGEKFAAKIGRIEIDRRPDHLCSSSTSTDDLVRYVPTIISHGIIMWTHVTSPLVGPDVYDALVTAYFKATANGEHDSLMSVTNCQTFIWDASGPINYDRNVEKWPRTQSLSPLHIVNSAAFMIDVALMREIEDRIGKRPLLYSMAETISYEIDWEEQFTLAERIYSVRNAE